MTSTSTIGVAFLGVGRLGETHLRNLTGSSGVQVLAVAHPNGEAAERGKVVANAEVYPPSLKLLLSSDALFLDMAALDLERFLVGEVEEAVAVTKSWKENRPFKVSEIQ